MVAAVFHPRSGDGLSAPPARPSAPAVGQPGPSRRRHVPKPAQPGARWRGRVPSTWRCGGSCRPGSASACWSASGRCWRMKGRPFPESRRRPGARRSSSSADPSTATVPNDQGVGWNLLASLQRVALGTWRRRSASRPASRSGARRCSGACSPADQPAASGLAAGLAADRLLVFKAANPAAIWTIFICSIWPMIINTAVGVQRCRRTTSTSRAC